MRYLAQLKADMRTGYRAWKWFACIAVVAIAVVTMTYEQHYSGEKYEAERQAGCVALAISPEEKHACDKEAQSRKDYTPWWYKLMAWPEGIGVWAVILTLAAITWQSDETRKSAAAALLNSQAFINSERPWIQVDFVEKGRGLGIEIRAVNKGRTPAALISRNKQRGVFDPIESSPKNPIYEPKEVFERPKIVFPGEALSLWWLISVEEATGIEKTSANINRFIDIDLEVITFGNIVYKDVLGGGATFETRWCYYVMPWNNPWGFLLIENATNEEYTART